MDVIIPIPTPIRTKPNVSLVLVSPRISLHIRMFSSIYRLTPLILCLNALNIVVLLSNHITPWIIEHILHRIARTIVVEPPSNHVQDITVHIEVEHDDLFNAVHEVTRLWAVGIENAEIDKIVAFAILFIIDPTNLSTGLSAFCT